MSSTEWTWNAQHNDYFRYNYDSNGSPTLQWSKPAQHNRVDSGQHNSGQTYQATAAYTQPDACSSAPADPAPPPAAAWEDVRYEPNFIAGTPSEGWYNSLDSSYRMRTGQEAREFFKLGRVFAMLYSEPAGETATFRNDDAFTTVRFNERVFSQIRRFVIVSVRRNFVHACAISTYGNRGTLKHGCEPSEHALVYNTGVDPETCYFSGEREKGLYKDPIEVYPAQSDTYLTKPSRIRFGKIYSIEWNVKVKDIGRVVAQDLNVLTAHYKEENEKYDQGA